jgi:hypothetical protein
MVIVVGLFKISQPLEVVRSLVKDVVPKTIGRLPGFNLAEAGKKD